MKLSTNLEKIEDDDEDTHFDAELEAKMEEAFAVFVGCLMLVFIMSMMAFVLGLVGAQAGAFQAVGVTGRGISMETGIGWREWLAGLVSLIAAVAAMALIAWGSWVASKWIGRVIVFLTAARVKGAGAD